MNEARKFESDMQRNKKEAHGMASAESCPFRIMYLRQFCRKKSGMRSIKVGENRPFRIWDTSAVLLMEGRAAKDSIGSTIRNCWKRTVCQTSAGMI